jgi:tetratricopeptide (TPR) repeat protein
MNASNLIVGLPGATWRRLHDLCEAGQLPNCAELIERGSLGHLLPTRPRSPARTWLISPDAPRTRPDDKPGVGGQLSIVPYQGTGFVVAAGEGIAVDQLIPEASVLDLCPSWLAAVGHNVPTGLSGRVLTALFTDAVAASAAQSKADAGSVSQEELPLVAAALAAADVIVPLLSAIQLFHGLLAPAAPSATKASSPGSIADPRRVARVEQQGRWNHALSLLDAGDSLAALPLLVALHADLPEQSLPALQLAETRMQLGDLDGARRAAVALLDLAPASVPGLLLMARLEHQAGDFEAALGFLGRAEHEGADSIMLHRQIAYTQLYLHRWDEAAERYDRALALDPDDLGSLLGKARALLALRRFGEARDHARQAIGTDYERPLAHFYLGLALVRLGDVEAGLAALKQAAVRAPTDLGGHAWVVRIMQRLGRSSEEQAPHRKAIQRLRSLHQRRRQQAGATRVALGALLETASKSVSEPASEPASELASDQDAFEDEPFDWSVLDAIPDQAPQPLDLVLICALPGGGAEQLSSRLADAGWRVASAPEHEIRQLGGELDAIAAREDQITRIAPELLSRLPRLHHYQLLFVRQSAERVADALSERAAAQGVARDELIRLADRYQRGVIQALEAAPHVDPLIVSIDDLAIDDLATDDLAADDVAKDALDAADNRLLDRLRSHIGEHRVALLSGTA